MRRPQYAGGTRTLFYTPESISGRNDSRCNGRIHCGLLGTIFVRTVLASEIDISFGNSVVKCGPRRRRKLILLYYTALWRPPASRRDGSSYFFTNRAILSIFTVVVENRRKTNPYIEYNFKINFGKKTRALDNYVDGNSRAWRYNSPRRALSTGIRIGDLLQTSLTAHDSVIIYADVPAYKVTTGIVFPPTGLWY